MDSKISVIVPVYNVEPYLERCLDSIINNTYRNLEIICVNDGSTDGCGAILDRYAQMDERFVVIYKENGGVSSARNRGLDVATGDYIAFVDADDWIHPQYFEIIEYNTRMKNYDAVICGIVRKSEMSTFEHYNVESVATKGLDLEGIFSNHAAKSYAGGKIYKKDLTVGKRFCEDVSFGEDVIYNASVFCGKLNVCVCYIECPLYFYYLREGSLVANHTHNDIWLLAQTYAQNAREAESDRVQRIFWREAIKRGLSARYGRSCIPGAKNLVKECNQLLHEAVLEFSRIPNTPVTEQIVYHLFTAVPSFYRLFRIVDDPTLLKMEKELKHK